MSQTTTQQPTRDATATLARAILALRPLAETGYRLRVDVPPAVVALAWALGVELSAAGGAPAGRFDAIVAGVLAPHLSAADGLVGPGRLEEIAGTARAEAFAGFRSGADVRTADGATLRTYAAGDPTRPAVVLASACGMPAELCEPWMRALAADHLVITWETRGLFADAPYAARDVAAFDRLAGDVAAQAGDLLAVLDHHGISTAHVMGLCGGAVIALRAAAVAAGRITSLSLWHGDFSGTATPTTGHQDNLKALLAMAAGSRADAAAINGALVATALDAVPADVAHLVVYPYADDELFYRYCILTGATMTTDLGALLPGITQPCLVVTSEDDRTAHPGGSHAIAGRLPRARLRVEPHGDHISVFGADARLQHILTDFLNTVDAAPSV